MQIQVRAAVDPDREFVRSLSEAVFAIYGAEYGEILARGVWNLSTYFVAFNETGPLGFATMEVINDSADLQAIAVSPEKRRDGVARELLTFVEAEARTRGATTLTLRVADENVSAQKFFEGAGFKKRGPVPQFPNGQTAFAMDKSLAK